MISDLDETLRELLKAELPVKNGEIEISFEQPQREWSAKLTRPSLNLFLYDLRENAQLRRHQWEKLANGNGHLNQVSMKRTPFRVDCFYMITAWAKEPADEHRLLTRTLHALFRYPILPQERLMGLMQNQPYDVRAAVARHDRLTNPAEVWSALDNEMRPTISYIVTLAIDPWQPVSGRLVRSLTLRSGQAAALPEAPVLMEDGLTGEMTVIGGTVHKADVGQAGVEVAVSESGLMARTDSRGRYTLGSLLPGAYTLIVRPEAGEAVEKEITIPAPPGEDYNVAL